MATSTQLIFNTGIDMQMRTEIFLDQLFRAPTMAHNFGLTFCPFWGNSVVQAHYVNGDRVG